MRTWNTRPFLTTRETARLLNVSRTSVQRWVDSGELKSYRTLGGHRRLRRADVAEFMRDRGLPLPAGLAHTGAATEDAQHVLLLCRPSAAMRALAKQLEVKAKAQVTASHHLLEGMLLLATLQPTALVVESELLDAGALKPLDTLRTHALTRTLPIVILGGPEGGRLHAPGRRIHLVPRPASPQRVLQALASD